MTLWHSQCLWLVLPMPLSHPQGHPNSLSDTLDTLGTTYYRHHQVNHEPLTIKGARCTKVRHSICVPWLGLCRAHVGGMLGTCWLYVGPCSAHVGPSWAYVVHVEPCWANVGPMLGQVGPMLSLCWAHVGPPRKQDLHTNPFSRSPTQFRPPPPPPRLASR